MVSDIAIVPDATLSTTQDWADYINGEWRKTVEGIISTGQALLQAKESLAHGSFGRLFGDIDRPVTFGVRTAQMLMAVAGRFSNTKYTSVLPPSWMTLYELTKPDSAIVDEWIETRVVHPELQQKDARRLVRSLKEQEPSTTPSPKVEAFDVKIGKAVLKAGDFRDRLSDLDDHSVDLILTDPPYPKEDLPLWSDLAEHAARVLAPRGILFAYTGQIFLPEVLNRLGEHLNYGWTFCLLMSEGSQSRIMGRHVMQAWKPVVAFTPNQWPSGEWHPDVFRGTGPEKDLYEWQQETQTAHTIVERYSPPNGVVVDPFLGVGSFGVAALKAGRRFVGIELDPKRFNQSVERLRAS